MRPVTSVLIDEPCADRAVEPANFLQQFTAVVANQIQIKHDITNLAVGLEILGRDVDVALEKYLVQPPQHARNIVVDMAETHAMDARMKLHLRKIDRAHGRPVDAIVEQLARNFPADPLLRLLG